jgi:NAD(P)H-dependent FMN reductase
MSAIERVVLLVGSPRGPRSASAALGEYLLARLAERGVSSETFMAVPATSSPAKTGALLAAMDEADLLAVVFPLYVDQLPAPLIAAMEAIAAHRQAQEDHPTLPA